MAAQSGTTLFVCTDGSMFFAEFSGDSATLSALGRSWKLEHTPSASGALYSDGSVKLWTKGQDGFVERDGDTVFRDCSANPPKETGQRWRSVTGNVNVPSPVENATLLVTLQDVSRADAPSRKIGERSYTVNGQGPFAFEVRYDPDLVNPRMQYSVAARLLNGEKLTHITDTRYSVIAGFPNQVDMTLKPVGSASFMGAWELLEIQYKNGSEAKPEDPTRYTLEFQRDERVAVRADCNRGRSQYTAQGDSLTFGPLALTRMACPPGSIASKYTKALEGVVSYAVKDGELHLAVKDESADMRFRRAGQSR
jgi:uncharacterized lipoprotein YbaY